MTALDFVLFFYLLPLGGVVGLVLLAVEWAARRTRCLRDHSKNAVGGSDEDDRELLGLLKNYVVWERSGCRYKVCKLPGSYWFYVTEQDNDSRVVQSFATLRAARQLCIEELEKR